MIIVQRETNDSRPFSPAQHTLPNDNDEARPFGLEEPGF
jgi:hypothetical protein